jgi:hypothetical protein
MRNHLDATSESVPVNRPLAGRSTQTIEPVIMGIPSRPGHSTDNMANSQALNRQPELTEW